MSDTPRSDRARADEHWPYLAVSKLASQLERELAESNEYARKLSLKITDLSRVIEQQKDDAKTALAMFAEMKERKGANAESIIKPIVLHVEEVYGGMGPDYAEIYLATGHVIQVNEEGLILWPSVAAYISGEDDRIAESLTLESKEDTK